MKTRDYSLDNIRFFLIFFVVFAHFIEVCAPFMHNWLIYRVIYTFHMPAFIFMFGYNARYSPDRIVFRWCIPYVVFQTAYIFFARAVLDTGTNFQYATPHWMLWYLVVCIFYQILLPLYDTDDRRRQILSLACVFLIAIIVGFVYSFGHYVTLSRFFVLQPWFLLGYYIRKNGFLEKLPQTGKKHFLILLITTALVILTVQYLYSAKLSAELLAGSSSYESCGGTVWMRLTVFLIAFIWILFLFLGIKKYLNRKIFPLTLMGQNTLPIFLLHGFFVRIISVYCPQMISSPWLVLAVTVALLLLL